MVTTIGLLLSGATLFLNSLVLMQKAEAKSVAVFNFFIGTLQVVIPLYLLLTSAHSNWDVFNIGSIFLFGFTYLYVGFTNYKGLDGSGLGWFSLWVAIIAIFYALVYFIKFHDVLNGLLWVMWAYLWYLFFAGLVLGKKIEKYTGIVAFIQSWITITLPAFLMIIGVWQNETITRIWYVILGAAILYFVVQEVKALFQTKKFQLFNQPGLKN